MHQNKKLPPAIKHGGYSGTTLLPGEDAAAFERLHKQLINELAPAGALEEDIVATLARIVWRKRNLATLRIAELAQDRYSSIKNEKLFAAGFFTSNAPSNAELQAVEAAAEAQARKELADTYELVECGDVATFEQLLEDLSVQERLDAMIDKCLKRLLFLRGLKSLAPNQPASPAPEQTSPAPVRRLRLT